MTQGRNETVEERLDRNWNELLQELRVMQTGVQILAAFLVVLPFQSRFTILNAADRVFYMVLLVFSALLIVLIVTPVAVHRHLFGHRVKVTTVRMGHAISKIVIPSVGILVAGCVWFVVQVLDGWVSGVIVGGATMLAVFILLFALPRIIKPSLSLSDPADEPGADEPGADVPGTDVPGTG
ncbi:DUF6328 family protein [Paeniglutamicibacter kerguelensis]|uniref:Multisubunit Na+/H+ antiporter MnhG subunit n=1 Tax=Paeniglutamicibacter kerguelensis TaxID=254788 RepID=A0ABS4X8I7_9MICC|nr:DUF6328 family protein [Paeniglutamicibacter kerguelensis]MBP2384782.1 multisubunit Na+/H+ antiporter MnhG subunit [Paeniglutamicibacter kerguelensis]